MIFSYRMVRKFTREIAKTISFFVKKFYFSKNLNILISKKIIFLNLNIKIHEQKCKLSDVVIFKWKKL